MWLERSYEYGVVVNVAIAYTVSAMFHMLPRPALVSHGGISISATYCASDRA